MWLMLEAADADAADADAADADAADAADDENEEEVDTEAGCSFKYTNEQIQDIVGSQSLESYINTQYPKYIRHVCRAENTYITKKQRKHITKIHGSRYPNYLVSLSIKKNDQHNP